jgi:hypothetical protein
MEKYGRRSKHLTLPAGIDNNSSNKNNVNNNSRDLYELLLSHTQCRGRIVKRQGLNKFPGAAIY